MTTAEAEVRAKFDQVIATMKDPDAIAKYELIREYLTNPTFRKQLEETVWKINNPEQAQ